MPSPENNVNSLEEGGDVAVVVTTKNTDVAPAEKDSKEEVPFSAVKNPVIELSSSPETPPSKEVDHDVASSASATAVETAGKTEGTKTDATLMRPSPPKAEDKSLLAQDDFDSSIKAKKDVLIYNAREQAATIGESNKGKGESVGGGNDNLKDGNYAGLIDKQEDTNNNNNDALLEEEGAWEASTTPTGLAPFDVPLPPPIPTEGQGGGRRQADPAEPGAFRARPGVGNRERQDALPFSLFGRAMGRPGAAEDGDRLAEARQVNEDPEGFPDAVPFDSKGMSRKAVEQRQLALCALVSILMGALLAVFLAVLMPRNDSNTEGSLRTPTLAPSLSPTETPSLAPTPLIADSLLTNETILAVMEDPFSPQAKAYEWLSGYPNITTVEDWRKVQLFALATFYYTYDGDNWLDIISRDWLAYDESECNWYSRVFGNVKYNIIDQKYEILGRDNNETTCTASGSFTRLSLLMPFKSGGNGLNPMPREITLLTELEEIQLTRMLVNGPLTAMILPDFKEMTSLKTIFLTDNNFTGSIPEMIFDALPPTLEEFSLSDSTIQGTIPKEYPLMLRTLAVSGDFIRGTVPSELGLLTNLESLSLGEGLLEGTIPEDLYGLTKLTELDLRKTNLNGTISPQIEAWQNLEWLNIDAHLSGTIPPGMLDLPNLSTLDLSNNELSGVFPEFQRMDKLTSLMISNNYLSGTIPSTLTKSNFTRLALKDNLLSGTVPEDIWTLTYLGSLDLSNNKGLMGSLPASQMSKFSRLGLLSLSNNAFYGSIPFANLKHNTNMHSLLLDGNLFSGIIPPQVGTLTALWHVNLAGNQLSGNLPSEIANCGRIQRLYLEDNQLSGPLPTELGLLGQSLMELNLSNNSQIAGHIPSEMGQLSNLKALLLGGTGLSGSVPQDVCLLKTEGVLAQIQVNCSAILCDCNCTCA